MGPNATEISFKNSGRTVLDGGVLMIFSLSCLLTPNLAMGLFHKSPDTDMCPARKHNCSTVACLPKTLWKSSKREGNQDGVLDVVPRGVQGEM